MTNKTAPPGTRHSGPDHSSPYPVSRLAPDFGLVDLAREIDRADEMLGARTSAKLRVIADQVKSLQTEARKILEQARREAELHHVRCAFRKVPGKTYYLYRDASGQLNFSMLCPEDWGGHPPQRFEGAYRLEADLSWTAADESQAADDSEELVQRLLDTPRRSR